MSPRIALLACLSAGVMAADSTIAPAQTQVNEPRTSAAPPQEIPETAAADDSPERAQRRIDTRGEESEAIAEPTDKQAAAETDVQTHTYLRARDLIGLTVQGKGNAELGTVYDVFIDPRTFGMQYVVLDTGAGVEGGGQFPILPWALFQMSAGASLNEGYLTAPLSVERLRGAPLIDVNEPDLVSTAAWINDVDLFYEEDLRTVRVARPDFDQNDPNMDSNNDPNAVNDRDSLPIGRRPVTPGTPTGADDGVETTGNRQGLRSQRDRLNSQRDRLNPQTQRRTPAGTQPGAAPVPMRDPSDPAGNTPANQNPPGGRNPPGNADRVDNPPGGRNPPGNANPVDNAPGGQTPPGNAGSSSQTPATGSAPTGGSVPSGGTPAGTAPAPGSSP